MCFVFECTEGWSYVLLWKQLLWKSRCHWSVYLCKLNRKAYQILSFSFLLPHQAVGFAHLTVSEKNDNFSIKVKPYKNAVLFGWGKLFCCSALQCVALFFSQHNNLGGQEHILCCGNWVGRSLGKEFGGVLSARVRFCIQSANRLNLVLDHTSANM